MRIAFNFLAVTAVVLGIQASAAAQTTVGVEQATFTNGFMNVFDINADGTQGGFVFGSGWGFNDLTAVFDTDTLTLGPNVIGDPNEFWYQNTTGTAPDPVNPGGPGQTGNKFMEANAFAEVQDGSLAGQTLTFSGTVNSNTLLPNPGINDGNGQDIWHEAVAFIKDFEAGFINPTVVEVPLPASGPFTVSLPLVPDASRPVQWGFTVRGRNVWSTDVAPFGTVEIAATQGNLTPSFGSYFQNFDGLDQMDADALANDGWTVFGEVFDTPADRDAGTSKFTYGADPAPNLFPAGPGSAFSNIAEGEGTNGAGDQYLNTFSDYNCCTDNVPNEGHFDPSDDDVVRSSIFNDQFTVGGEDVGRDVEFAFDIKLPANTPDALASPSTASVFIRTVNPADGTVSGETIKDVTTISGLNDATFVADSITMELMLSQVGHIFQFGLTNDSSDFDPTGVYLDNISLTDVGGIPGDNNGDGDVDGDDFLAWQRISPSGIPQWQGNYPTPSALGGVASVPEPSTATAALLALLALGATRRRC